MSLELWAIWTDPVLLSFRTFFEFLLCAMKLCCLLLFATFVSFTQMNSQSRYCSLSLTLCLNRTCWGTCRFLLSPNRKSLHAELLLHPIQLILRLTESDRNDFYPVLFELSSKWKKTFFILIFGRILTGSWSNTVLDVLCLILHVDFSWW